MKREFLMLAHNFQPEKHSIGMWFVSDKLDGMRAFWDGGATRGMELKDVPWANTDKDARYRVQPKSTGLWSRYGKTIQAPDNWLDKLPQGILLDGELWSGERQFQMLISTTKDLTPGAGWDKVKYKIFDIPPAHVVFANGEIKNTNFKKVFSDILHKGLKISSGPSMEFRHVVDHVKNTLEHKWNNIVSPLEQTQLSSNDTKAFVELCSKLSEVENKGGEGLMLRHPKSLWVTSRSHNLLKVKSLHDAEAVVVGYTSGRETDLGSKLLGLMGALIVTYKGKEFELSGFTEVERRLEINGDYIAARTWCENNPGQRVTVEGINNPMFPKGTVVTFKYRELTDDGKPKEARYFRTTNKS